MGLNLSNVFQRPYTVKDAKTLVKKKQDEEKSAGKALQEEQADSNSKSRGLQYAETKKNTSYTPAYQQINAGSKQGYILPSSYMSNKPSESAPAQDVYTSSEKNRQSSKINIAQILKDFKSTAKAIGTPDDLNDEVNTYVALIEKQILKDEPNIKLIKSNLKNASSLLDNYISKTLNKDSKVVENWVDALFLQNIDFKYNENDINHQFLVKFPEGSTQEAEKTSEKTEIRDTAVNEPDIEKNDIQTGVFIPQDKELKALFIQSKKLSYANEPKKALVTFQKALQRAEEVNDNETKSKIYFEVGKIYDDYDYYAQALKSYHKSLETTTDNNIKTKAHYSMAQIYDDVNQITPALDHYFSSVSFGGEAENLAAQSTSLAKMGNIYSDLYEDEAFNYFDIAKDIASETSNSKVKGFVSSSLGKTYEKFGEPQEALTSYKEAVKYYDEAESPLKTAQNYVSAADIMKKYNNPAKAKGLLQKALKYARQTDDVNLMNEINRKLEDVSVVRI